MTDGGHSPSDPYPHSVALRLLRALSRHGVRWLFCNSGSDFPPIAEALAAATAEQSETLPTAVLVPHENVAISMAYGAALVTGEPQIVMVHVGLGTANAICGLFNAARHRIPILLIAGRTPVLESGRVGARNNYINWAQEMFDQAGMVRELVKWDYELRDPQQVAEVIDRALVAATSAPAGPAYLVLPREVLSTPVPPDVLIPKAVAVPKAGRPRADDIAELAGWLAEAKRPLIVTSSFGCSSAAFTCLDRFAEKWAIPVVQYRPRFMSLPCHHPMHVGYDPNPWVRDADCILVIESDVPWIPDETQPAADCRVAHLGVDPLFRDYPMRSFESKLSIAADPLLALDDLETRLHEQISASELEEVRLRRERLLARCREAPEAERMQGAPILSNAFVSRCIAEAMDSHSVLINEYSFTLEEARVTRSGQFFSHSPAGGLGWALGAALGVKLASPDRTVIATVGDGTYMFGNPVSAHFVARAMGLPFLTVIYNNRRWAAVHRATLSMYPYGAAAQAGMPPLSVMEPSPDFERIVEASGGLGIRVECPSDLMDALQRALNAVRGGRQAVVNVLTQASYVRTS